MLIWRWQIASYSLTNHIDDLFVSNWIVDLNQDLKATEMKHKFKLTLSAQLWSKLTQFYNLIISGDSEEDEDDSEEDIKERNFQEIEDELR